MSSKYSYSSISSSLSLTKVWIFIIAAFVFHIYISPSLSLNGPPLPQNFPLRAQQFYSPLSKVSFNAMHSYLALCYNWMQFIWDNQHSCSKFSCYNGCHAYITAKNAHMCTNVIIFTQNTTSYGTWTTQQQPRRQSITTILCASFLSLV